MHSLLDQGEEAQSMIDAALNLFIKPSEEFSSGIERWLRSNDFRPLPYEAGDFLFSQGEDVKHSYYIEHGLVRLYSTSEEGYAKTLFYHKARTLIGYHFYREDTHSVFNAVACTTCTIYQIPHTRMLETLKSDPIACFNMSIYLFDQLEQAARETVNTALFSTLQRLSALLLALAEEHGSTTPPITVPYSNLELAEMLGVHRNSVNNAMAALKRGGSIEKKSNGLIIVNTKRLSDMARGI
jgi:CRP-like cAMP-binding protein